MQDVHFDFGSAELAKTKLHALGLTGAAKERAKQLKRPSVAQTEETGEPDHVRAFTGHVDAFIDQQARRAEGQYREAYIDAMAENPGDQWLFGAGSPVDPLQRVVVAQQDLIDSLSPRYLHSVDISTKK